MKFNWEIRLDIIEKYSWIAEQLVPTRILNSDKIMGQGGVKPHEHYDYMHRCALALLLDHEYFGYHQMKSQVTTLAEKEYIQEYRETVICGVKPTLAWIIAYMQATYGGSFEMDEIMNIKINDFKAVIKQRFKKHGWWSQTEAERRIRCDDPDNDAFIDDHGAKNMCRGVELRFVRFCYFSIHNFAFFKNNKDREACSRKVWATDDEKKSLREPMSPVWEAKYAWQNGTMRWN